MVDLFKKYNLNKEEVSKWAKEHYPNVANVDPISEVLLNLMAQLYVREVMGTEVQPSDVETITGPISNASDLTEGEWANIQVAVGVKIRETTYMGCPICYKSLPKEGPPNCEKDGPVEPAVHTWSRYIAADNSGEVMVSIPPRLSKEYKDLMGSVIKARGSLNEQGEFNIQSLNILTGMIPEAVPLKEKAQEFVDQAEVQTFTNMLQTFPSMTREDLERWHTFQKVKTPLPILLSKSGAEEFEESGQRKYRLPRKEQS